jgi:YbbR domain-containing protein
MRAWILDNLGLKLLSVFLAAFLWAVVLSEQKIEVTVNIPLEFKDIPPRLVLVNEPLDTLQVRLRGPQTLVTALAPREVALNTPPHRFKEGENLIPIPREAIRLPRGIEAVEVTPPRVRLLLEALVEREVEVSPRVQGTPAKSHVLKRVTSDPPRIRLAGPKSEIQRLWRVYTLPINLDGQTATFTTQATLEPMGRQVRILDNTPITVGVEIAPRKS